jgi:DNA-binding TFAR19-related protein (PDSD5 family)
MNEPLPQTPTPRTDAETIYPGSGIAMVRPEFARQLERELAQANQTAQEATQIAYDAWRLIVHLRKSRQTQESHPIIP